MSKVDYEIEDFMEYCQSKGLSKKTMKSYEQTLKLFAKYLLEEKGMISTKEANILLFQTRIAENGINHKFHNSTF